MMRFTQRLAAIIGVTLLVGSVSVPAQYMRPPDPPPVEITQKLDAQVPLDLTFYDESGKSVTLRSLMNGKPAVLALVYYECPMLCGEVLNGMLDVFNETSLEMGGDYEVLCVSFNPREKSDLATLKKKNFIEHYTKPGAEENWHFLTGEESNIRPLADAVGFGYQYMSSTDEYAHAAGIILLTPEGRTSRYLYGIQYPERDLRFGLIEAAEGKVGSLVDAAQLLCYRYDPTIGGYAFTVIKIARWLGAVTVVGIVVMVVYLLRFERRRAREYAESMAGNHTALNH